MRSIAREIGFAFLAWLVPFIVAVCIFPLKTSHPPLFESLMAVTLAGSTVVIGSVYLRRTSSNVARQGIKIGLLWMAANWMLDGLMFSHGPMKMNLSHYAMDIGTAYLMIPLITIGLGMMGRVAVIKRVSQ